MNEHLEDALDFYLEQELYKLWKDAVIKNNEDREVIIWSIKLWGVEP